MTTLASPPAAEPSRVERLRADMARNMPLFRHLVRREVRQRYKGSIFGLAWTLINPLLMVGAYSLVFHYVWRVLDLKPYALFLFVGLTVWTFFMNGAQVMSSSLVANATLVKKVRFPREILPLTAMAGNGVTAGAMFALALPLSILLAPGTPTTLVILPYFIVCLAALTAGFGLALAALNVYLRDIEHILAAIAMPWYFLTPIFYTFDGLPGVQVPHWILQLLYYGNPITPYVTAFQQAMFFGDWPGVGTWIYCAVVGGVALVGGLVLFRRLDGEFAVEL